MLVHTPRSPASQYERTLSCCMVKFSNHLLLLLRLTVDKPLSERQSTRCEIQAECVPLALGVGV